MRRLLILLALLSIPSLASAKEGWRDWCWNGGKKVTTSGLQSTTTVQATTVSCTVTIYVHGGSTLATVFADNNGTPLANPFTGSTPNGQFIWYAANGRYDQTINVIINGTANTVTMSDILLCDPFEVGSTCNNGGATTAHNLLSTTHLDTIPKSPPTRGDVITAQNQTSPTGVNPSWASLAIGTSGYVLTSDGTDASWQPIPGGSTIQIDVNGVPTNQVTKNFNSTQPTPGAGFLATTYDTTVISSVDEIISKIAISGNTTTVASSSGISGTGSVCGDGSGNVTTTSCVIGGFIMPNDISTGTIVNKIATSVQVGVDAFHAKLPGLGTQQQMIGICTSGCGTTGDATITIQSDSVNCVFDNGTTIGDIIVQSSTIAGDCHDTGTSDPGGAAAGQTFTGNIMLAISNTVGAGTHPVKIYSMVTGNAPVHSGSPSIINQFAQWRSTNSLSGSSLWWTTNGNNAQILATATQDNTPDFFSNNDAFMVKTTGNATVQAGIGIKFGTAAASIATRAFELWDSTNTQEMMIESDGYLVFNDFNAGFCSMPGYALRFASVDSNLGGLLQKVNSTSTTATLLTTDKFGSIGASVNCFNEVTIGGRGRVNIDNAYTVGDYLVPSTSAGGSAHSNGAVWPFTGQIVGKAYATNGGSANAVKYFPMESEVRGGAFGLYNNDQLAQVAAVTDTTMFTVGGTTTDFRFSGGTACTTTSAAATATLNLKYTDTSNTAQTVSVTSTCTALGASSVAQITQSFRAKNGTNITYGVTIANTPTYDVFARLEALGPN